MKQLFNPRIFRDIDNVDYKQNRFSVIFRVVRYGDIQDLKNLKKVYSKKDISDFLIKRGKELDLGEKKLLNLMYS